MKRIGWIGILTFGFIILSGAVSLASSYIQLTTDVAADTAASWSPDGNKIAYSSGRGGTDDIWVMNADGSGQTQITSSAAAETSPSWSPDGSKIAFASSISGGSIWVMNADGSGQTQLTTSLSGRGSPSWSPDGTRIAFTSASKIWTMNADGSGQTQLTSEIASDGHPSWSLDGSRILFHRTQDGSTNRDIWMMNADGSGQTRLTIDPGDDFLPSWSSDGNKIVFTSDRAGQAIWIMNADGTGQAQITSYGVHPAWSPDGTKIAFNSDNGGNNDIWIYQLQFDLSISMLGKGRITVSPGFNCSDSCRQKINAGETVTLTAENTPTATFNRWTSGCDEVSGNVCTVYMTGARTISAEFTGVSIGFGTISGRVVDSAGAGVEGALVRPFMSIYNISTTTALTDVNGYYNLTNLLPGTYIVQFMNEAVPRGTAGSAYTTNQYYNNKYSLGSADLLTVAPSVPLDLGTAVYPAFGQISGRVTDIGGIGIENVQVTVYDVDEQARDSAYTDASGNYTVQHVPSGKYRIRFKGNISFGGPVPTPARNLVQQVAYVTVTAPETLTGINAVLFPGQSISGQITNSQGLPVAGSAAILDLNGNPPIASASTDSTGAYRAVGIPPGNYKVRFGGNFYYNGIPVQSNLDVTRLYSRRYYGGSAEMDEASIVTVTSGVDAVNIDGILDGTGPAINAPFMKDFGVKVVGESTIRSFNMLRNGGTADLTIGTVSLSGSDFAILNDRCSGVTLPTNGRCTIQVSFAPLAEGDRSGTVTIPSNDPDFPLFHIALKGSGGAPDRPDDSGTAGVPSGDNVTVTPTSDVNLTFSSVSPEVEGDVTVTALTTFSSPAPSNFSLLDGTSYEITTTAVFTGPITICINYDPAVIANPFNEPNLRLFHYNATSGSWEDITLLPVDTDHHQICGQTDSLSPFGIALPTGNLSPVLPPGAGVGQCGPDAFVTPTLGSTATGFQVADLSTFMGGLTGKIYIDWGDGSPMEIIAAGATSGLHTYANPGTYKIRKTTQDDQFGFNCWKEAEVTVSDLASGGFGSVSVTANACAGGALADVNVYLTSGHLSFHGATNSAGLLVLPLVTNIMPVGTYSLSVYGPQGITCHPTSTCDTALPATVTAPGTLAVYCQ